MATMAQPSVESGTVANAKSSIARCFARRSGFVCVASKAALEEQAHVEAAPWRPQLAPQSPIVIEVVVHPF